MAAALIAGYEHSLWFMDPIGGILISLYICARWTTVCHEQFILLLGQSAPRAFLSQLTYLAMIHDERILKVDTVLAYRLGSKYHCEVHIVLPADMPLKVAHDIGESLEQNIEKIEDVELAWVHLDFEWSHVAEHNRSKL
jgi:divalent metal cation (Fe/Co/Zn/Cd) transporter